MDIKNIFKSKTRKELFRLYFTNPSQEYYLRELERLLKIPVSMIQRELKSLEKSGIFSFQKRGNLTYYYLNRNYPLFEELKSIVFKTVGIKGLIKETLEKMKKTKVAFLYGSFAKNEEQADSDIDLFLIGNVDERKLVLEIGQLEKILRREINYTIYSLAEFRKKKQRHNAFIMDIMQNPKIFVIGDENDLR